MRKGLIIICSLFFFLSCNEVAKMISEAGFVYDSRQDIYVSKIDSLQRKAGYSYIIDLAAIPVGMVIDCEPVIFAYNGQTYMIELWKGQYDLSTGAEIGIYKRSPSGPLEWECGENSDMLYMTFTLKKRGNEVFRRSGTHWWLTGFKPGQFCNPADLTMDISINFSNRQGMLNPFVYAMRQLGYGNIQINGSTVRFSFDRPKTKQPITDPLFIAETQRKNRLLVDTYNNLKREVNVRNNSPDSIEKMLIKMPELIAHIINYKRR